LPEPDAPMTARNCPGLTKPLIPTYTTSLCAEAMGFYGCNVASHSMPLYIALPL
jgi:hypothetical protein